MVAVALGKGPNASFNTVATAHEGAHGQHRDLDPGWRANDEPA